MPLSTRRPTHTPQHSHRNINAAVAPPPQEGDTSRISEDQRLAAAISAAMKPDPRDPSRFTLDLSGFQPGILQQIPPGDVGRLVHGHLTHVLLPPGTAAVPEFVFRLPELQHLALTQYSSDSLQLRDLLSPSFRSLTFSSSVLSRIDVLQSVEVTRSATGDRERESNDVVVRYFRQFESKSLRQDTLKPIEHGTGTDDRPEERPEIEHRDSSSCGGEASVGLRGSIEPQKPIIDDEKAFERRKRRGVLLAKFMHQERLASVAACRKASSDGGAMVHQLLQGGPEFDTEEFLSRCERALALEAGASVTPAKGSEEARSCAPPDRELEDGLRRLLEPGPILNALMTVLVRDPADKRHYTLDLKKFEPADLRKIPAEALDLLVERSGLSQLILPPGLESIPGFVLRLPRLRHLALPDYRGKALDLRDAGSELKKIVFSSGQLERIQVRPGTDVEQIGLGGPRDTPQKTPSIDYGHVEQMNFEAAAAGGSPLDEYDDLFNALRRMEGKRRSDPQELQSRRASEANEARASIALQQELRTLVERGPVLDALLKVCPPHENAPPNYTLNLGIFGPDVLQQIPAQALEWLVSRSKLTQLILPRGLASVPAFVLRLPNLRHLGVTNFAGELLDLQMAGPELRSVIYGGDRLKMVRVRLGTAVEQDPMDALHGRPTPVIEFVDHGTGPSGMNGTAPDAPVSGVVRAGAQAKVNAVPPLPEDDFARLRKEVLAGKITREKAFEEIRGRMAQLALVKANVHSAPPTEYITQILGLHPDVLDHRQVKDLIWGNNRFGKQGKGWAAAWRDGPLQAALRSGHLALLGFLLGSGAENGSKLETSSRWVLALQSRSVGTFNLLLGEDMTIDSLDIPRSEIDRPDGLGYTPLMCAVLTGNLEVVKRVVELGAKLGVERGGWTAQRLASQAGHGEIAAWLAAARGAEQGPGPVQAAPLRPAGPQPARPAPVRSADQFYTDTRSFLDAADREDEVSKFLRAEVARLGPAPHPLLRAALVRAVLEARVPMDKINRVKYRLDLLGFTLEAAIAGLSVLPANTESERWRKQLESLMPFKRSIVGTGVPHDDPRTWQGRNRERKPREGVEAPLLPQLPKLEFVENGGRKLETVREFAAKFVRVRIERGYLPAKSRRGAKELFIPDPTAIPHLHLDDFLSWKTRNPATGNKGGASTRACTRMGASRKRA